MVPRRMVRVEKVRTLILEARSQNVYQMITTFQRVEAAVVEPYTAVFVDSYITVLFVYSLLDSMDVTVMNNNETGHDNCRRAVIWMWFV